MKVRKIYMFIIPMVIFFMACSDDLPGSEEETDPPTIEDENPTEEEDKKPSNGEYQLVWEDQFEGTELNGKNWTIEVNGNGGGNNEIQYYRAENITLGEEPASGKSCLIITAKKENFQPNPPNGTTWRATSGRLTTENKQIFTYGKIEASIKLPKTADGLWPAFWMLGNDNKQVSWPKSGEIDILEMGHVTGITSGTQDRYFNGACHWGTAWNKVYSHARHHTWDYSLQDDAFHLYTMIWDEEAIRMYIDQDIYPDVEPYYQLSITSKNGETAAGTYFHKDFFIILNLAVGGDFPQIWNIDQISALSGGEAYMYVDFVRVYQKK